MEVAVRPAVADDAPAVEALLEEVAHLHREALSSRFRDVAGAGAEIPTFAEGEGVVLVAESEGRIVGALVAEVRKSPDYPVYVPRRWLQIRDLVVAADARRRGVGRALMSEAEAWALQAGIRELELTVWDFNVEARRFYEALGWRTVYHQMGKQLAE